MARGTFGERLKRERELREVTFEEITSATRISSRFLEALENEDWDKLPGGVFNRGFVRSIARYLGLDEEALLGEYDLAHGAQAPPATERPEERIPSPPKWMPIALLLAAMALLAVAIVGGRYAWRYYQARRARTYSMSGNAQAVPLNLSVSASAVCRVRVLADGNLVFDTDLQAGENRHLTALHEFEVTASDSGAVLLDLNGQTVPPLGVPGSSGTIKLSAKDLRQPDSGNAKP